MNKCQVCHPINKSCVVRSGKRQKRPLDCEWWVARKGLGTQSARACQTQQPVPRASTFAATAALWETVVMSLNVYIDSLDGSPSKSVMVASCVLAMQ
jgi:hypothetical protein